MSLKMDPVWIVVIAGSFQSPGCSFDPKSSVMRRGRSSCEGDYYNNQIVSINHTGEI